MIPRDQHVHGVSEKLSRSSSTRLSGPSIHSDETNGPERRGAAGRERKREAAIFNFIAPLARLSRRKRAPPTSFFVRPSARRTRPSGATRKCTQSGVSFSFEWTVARTGTEWDDAITVGRSDETRKVTSGRTQNCNSGTYILVSIITDIALPS